MNFQDNWFADAAQGYDDTFVFPPDGRFPIRSRGTARAPRDFPLQTICHLQDVTGVCTGTLIAPQVVLTARHCLVGAGPVTVTPALDLTTPSGARPFGAQVVPTANFRTHPTLDIGALILPRAFPHRKFMLLQPRSARLSLTLLSIAGYPGDKPAGTMWGHSERITRVTPTTLEYTIDTFSGQSGAPVWLLGNDSWRVLLGVHSGNRGGGAGTNLATRITCEVIDTITGWCRAARVAGPSVDSFYARSCAAGARVSDSAP